MNPGIQTYFLFVSRSNFMSMKYSDLIDALLSYPNINLRFLNLVEYSKGTLLEDFFIRNELANSSNPLEHTSDVLRMLTMYKYGGVYLDLDVISLVPFNNFTMQPEIKKNFVCAQGRNDLANGIVKVEVESGREVMKSILQ
jgi:lactosylceramide 4-alpha-galactosyltransferase